SGKNIALANKESLIIAGEQITSEAQKKSVKIFPVDSEPNAIWQCIQGENSPINKVFITSSGGSLRSKPVDFLANSTVEETLKHPNWSMGAKITVDSATLMNKVFEVIEAKWLFGLPWEKIDVIVHPQSQIHSMVEFLDGSIKAQIGVSDMKSPIQYAFLYPERLKNPTINQFNPIKNNNLTFLEVDNLRYPCFELGIQTAKKGNTWPAVLCGADEGAVELFLSRKIKFTDIFSILDKVIQNHKPIKDPSLSDMIEASQNAYIEAINTTV
ncbi:MAG: 1-deoxy-D-xylulose-5-phosphate reductoisomerase, partial [SAR202 cluster bacterium]